MRHFITCESVTEGHPDKLCDQVSDAILDACLSQDPTSRVACECLATSWIIIVAWEITTRAKVDYERIVRDTICAIWYDSDEKHFNGNTCKVELLLHHQSPDIAQGVDTWWAGDQWIMYGYASNETESFLPLPIFLAHTLAKKLAEVRKNWTLSYLYPDGKTQVTVEYENNLPVRIDTIVVSAQHAVGVSQEQIRQDIITHVISPVAGRLIDEQTTFFINPTWLFTLWWPAWDTWLTWRKIIVDTYGWIWRHWWWAFSWKDPTKVDRSWAYMMRYLAKNIVASWVCERCELQVGYAIGVVQPVSIYLDCFGTEKVGSEKIIEVIKNNFDLSPKWIIEKLDLRKPLFKYTAVYGHFWRDEFTWEHLDSIETFKKLL